MSGSCFLSQEWCAKFASCRTPHVGFHWGKTETVHNLADAATMWPARAVGKGTLWVCKGHQVCPELIRQKLDQSNCEGLSSWLQTHAILWPLLAKTLTTLKWLYKTSKTCYVFVLKMLSWKSLSSLLHNIMGQLWLFLGQPLLWLALVWANSHTRFGLIPSPSAGLLWLGTDSLTQPYYFPNIKSMG